MGVYFFLSTTISLEKKKGLFCRDSVLYYTIALKNKQMILLFHAHNIKVRMGGFHRFFLKK